MDELEPVSGAVNASGDDFDEIGMDESSVARVSEDLAAKINASLGMKAISIRLPESLVESFKLLANIHGVGYQPLMRDALVRFAHAELKKMAIEYSNALDEKKFERPQPPDSDPDDDLDNRLVA